MQIDWMRPVETPLGNIPRAVLVGAGVAIAVAGIAVAWGPIKRMRQRREWAKLPPPEFKKKPEEQVLKLPRRKLGDTTPPTVTEWGDPGKQIRRKE
jgi:hypothetical protein